MLIRKRKHIEVSIDKPQETLEQEFEPMHIVDFCCLPEAELMSTESRAFLEQAASELPPNLKVVFLLRDIEGLSTKETAEVLDLTETAVKTRLSRARLNLRQQLSNYFGERYAKQIQARGRIPKGENV